MAEIIITKKSSKGEDVFYHAEPEYNPPKIADICEEFIVNYCEANGHTDWLVEMVNTKVPTKKLDEEGNPKKVYMPFVSLRSEFAKKFFPKCIKGDSGKKPSFRDTINTKYGKK